MVLPGVTIGDDVIVAAGAVVAADCAPGGVYAGVPARRIRDTDTGVPPRKECDGMSTISTTPADNAPSLVHERGRPLHSFPHRMAPAWSPRCSPPPTVLLDAPSLLRLVAVLAFVCAGPGAAVLAHVPVSPTVHLLGSDQRGVAGGVGHRLGRLRLAERLVADHARWSSSRPGPTLSCAWALRTGRRGAGDPHAPPPPGGLHPRRRAPAAPPGASLPRCCTGCRLRCCCSRGWPRGQRAWRRSTPPSGRTTGCWGWSAPGSSSAWP